jgi:hypothetical protein
VRTTLLRTADYGNVSIFGTDAGEVFAWKHNEDVGPVLPPDIDPVRVRAGVRDYYRRNLRELPSVRLRPNDDPPSYESLTVDTIRVELHQWAVRYLLRHPAGSRYDQHLFVTVNVGWDDDARKWVVADPLPHHERRQYVGPGPIYR